jgi:hypothetical protein
VMSGDLFHAERPGAMVTPHEAAPHLAEARRKIIETESRLIATSRDRGNFLIECLTSRFPNS